MEYTSLEELLLFNQHTFGSYVIKGTMYPISSIVSQNVVSYLYYHNDVNQFLLVKKYKSGKYHIDFLHRVDAKECLYHRNNVLMGESIDVAECHYQGNSKFLSYDSIEDAYVVSSCDGFKRYQTTFRKNFFDDK
jgi:hypothetical protein